MGRHPRTGSVGVGIVAGEAQPMRAFSVVEDGRRRLAIEAQKGGTYRRDDVDDLELCEWFVPVRWLDTVDMAHAVLEVGFFGIRNTVAAPRAAGWGGTVERLTIKFPRWNGMDATESAEQPEQESANA